MMLTVDTLDGCFWLKTTFNLIKKSIIISYGPKLDKILNKSRENVILMYLEIKLNVLLGSPLHFRKGVLGQWPCVERLYCCKIEKFDHIPDRPGLISGLWCEFWFHHPPLSVKLHSSPCSGPTLSQPCRPYHVGLALQIFTGYYRAETIPHENRDWK